MSQNTNELTSCFVSFWNAEKKTRYRLAQESIQERIDRIVNEYDYDIGTLKSKCKESGTNDIYEFLDDILLGKGVDDEWEVEVEEDELHEPDKIVEKVVVRHNFSDAFRIRNKRT